MFAILDARLQNQQYIGTISLHVKIVFPKMLEVIYAFLNVISISTQCFICKHAYTMRCLSYFKNDHYLRKLGSSDYEQKTSNYHPSTSIQNGWFDMLTSSNLWVRTLFCCMHRNSILTFYIESIIEIAFHINQKKKIVVLVFIITTIYQFVSD